jgi:hypothetical protein
MVNYKPGQMRRHKAPTRKHLHALNQIAAGARLEYVNRKYWLAGRRIPTSIGHTLLKEGWVNTPPDLIDGYGPDAGGLTKLGRAEVRYIGRATA